MPNFEYKVVPAPKKGLKGRGVKGTEEKFANAMAAVINELGAEGWEYQRSDTLPCEERSGLRGKTTTFHNMLIFRRKLALPEATTSRPVTPRHVKKAAGKPARLLESAIARESGTAPAVGPATEATEVKDPRLGTGGQ